MEPDQLVRKYIDAWNRQNVAAVLDLMHPGAAYYDGFWMESCVGRDLEQYFQDSMKEEPFWYEKVGETIITDNGVAYRYSVHQPTASDIGDPIFFGAELLSIEHGKILTVTDLYCSPNVSQLKEIALLAANRHGLTRHANAGFGALKAARIKANLISSLVDEKVYLDPEITLSQLARKVGCTLDQLALTVKSHLGLDLEQLLDSRRIEHAKSLLTTTANGPEHLARVAAASGFASLRAFSAKFVEFVGVAPADYRRKVLPEYNSNADTRLH